MNWCTINSKLVFHWRLLAPYTLFMFQHSLKTAFRSLIRNRSYTIINIGGLAVGIAVCFVLFIIIQFHTTFDDFHTNKDRVYRVLTEAQTGDAGKRTYAKNVPFPMPEALKTAFPQLEQVAPVYASHNDELQVLDNEGTPVKNFKEESGVFYTTPSFQYVSIPVARRFVCLVERPG